MKIVTPIEIKETADGIDKEVNNTKISVFLAGTIDDGSSKNWQNEVISEINSNISLPYLTIYNPRRDNWGENVTEEEQMKQIDWEQKYLKESDLIIMVLLDNSKSPISLMELGQYSNSGKLVVCCTEKFYRYHNVKWMCNNRDIILINTNDIKEIAKIILVAVGQIKK